MVRYLGELTTEIEANYIRHKLKTWLGCDLYIFKHIPSPSNYINWPIN